MRTFRVDLNLAPWHLVHMEDNPNRAWEIWSRSFLAICDFHAPKRKRKVRNNFAPWLTPEIKKLMFERDKLRRASIIYNSDAHWTEYKIAWNNVNVAIRKAKSNYYKRYFETNIGNIKKSWKGVNSILGRTQPATEINRIDIGDNSITTPLEISNVLNYQFTHIGPRLAGNIPETSEIVPSLNHIINLSIRSGCFPEDWKISKVLPLYKENIKSDPNNYRPISILPVVSKVLEKVMFKQRYECLTDNNLLAVSQYGFRPKHSTLTALLVVTNTWYLNIDDGLLNSVLFLDLKKAFGTVDHSILLKKLQLYGLDSHTVQWFKSYLSNRFQSTLVNGTLSDYLPVSCRVPQGSVLGPLLFLIYINDLQECELSSSPLMYADDTAFTLSAYDPTTLAENLNKDLEEVQKWLKSNKLTLNVKKTKYVIIGSHYRLRHLNGDLNVTVNGQRLTRATNYRYLGMEVDEALGWQPHVDTFCKKVSAGIGAIKRIRSLLPRQTLLKMYDALVAHYFDYCSEVWGCMGKGL